MTDLPLFPRAMLASVFNGDQRMISTFEDLLNRLKTAVEQAEQASGVSTAVTAAEFILSAPYSELTGASVLAAGAGIDLADASGTLTVSVDTTALPTLSGGNAVTFLTTGATSLLLPTVGTLATLADISGAISGSVASFNTRTGAVTLLSADVTGALGYTPTSVTGLTGAQSVAAFKTGLSLVKADVGLGSVDNTADAAKNVLTATKLFTARNFTITGDGSWTVSFDGSAAVSAGLTLATVNSNIGSFGSATKASTFTVDGKGRLTAAGEVTITPAFASITGTPTTLAGYGITDAQPLDADLTTIAGLTATTDNFIVSVASAWASRTPAQVRTTLGLVIGTNVQAYDPDLTTWAGITPGTGVGTALAVNVGSAGAFVTFNGALGTPSSGTLTNCTFPILNQNTTGSAAKWTTARNLAGNSVDGSANVAFANKFIVQGTSDSGLSAAQFLGSLGTGIVKNTTTTGVLSIAVAADFPTLNQNTTGSAGTLTTSRNIDGQAFNGSADITVIAPGTHAATSKATPVDADELPLVDSAASNVLKKLPWANLKATLKSYFDTLYAATVSPSALTLASGWTDYGAPFQTAIYSKSINGWVSLGGLITGSGGAGTTLFTLPAGYRPANRRMFVVNSAGALGRLDIESNGDASIVVGSTTSYISLEGIGFYA